MRNYVIATGTDCDGGNSGHCYVLSTEKEAEGFAEELASGSDGLMYGAVAREEAEEYCEDYGISLPELHDDYDWESDQYEPDDYDNGYSANEQASADRSDYASESSCPIQAAERRMGA